MTDLLPYALSLAAGLLGLLFAPAVDRWAERFDAWVGGGRSHDDELPAGAGQGGVGTPMTDATNFTPTETVEGGIDE